MLKNVLISCLVPVALLAGTPVISLDRVVHSFGTISPNEKAHARFQVTNTGDETLRLIRVDTSCDCTSAVLGQPFLNPGEATSLEVVYDPIDQKGSVIKGITILSNDPKHPAIHLTLDAKIMPAILTSQDDLFFSGLLRSDRLTQTVRCTSASGRTVRILGMLVNPPPFLQIESETEGQDALVKVTLVASKLPQDQTLGKASLRLRTNDVEMPEMGLMIFWATGQAIQPTPRRISFEPGIPGSIGLTLKHARGRPFRILGVSIKPDCFLVEGISTQAAPQHELTVLFKPNTLAVPPVGQLLFETNDPDQPEVAVEATAFVP